MSARSIATIVILAVLAIPLQVLCECPASPDHFAFTANTGNTYSIVITKAMVMRQPLEVGDEIGIFDGDLCVGAACWETPPVGITAWGDDPQTGDKDGFACGRPIKFKIWDSSRGGYRVVRADYADGDGYFCTGFAAVVDLCWPRARAFLLEETPEPR